MGRSGSGWKVTKTHRVAHCGSQGSQKLLLVFGGPGRPVWLGSTYGWRTAGNILKQVREVCREEESEKQAGLLGF
jgi:hypothetical protein